MAGILTANKNDSYEQDQLEGISAQPHSCDFCRLLREAPIPKMLGVTSTAAHRSTTRKAKPRRYAKTSVLPALDWQPRALLVGCETQERLYLRTRLSLHRALVREAWTAEQALDYCTEHEVHLVFIDADVLGDQALALCRQLRRPHPCWPVPQVLLLGTPGQGMKWRLRGAWTGSRWLAKPLHPRELEQRLLRPLRLEKLPAALRPVSLFGDL